MMQRCPLISRKVVRLLGVLPIQQQDEDVAELTSTGLLLKDGRTIEADVILDTTSMKKRNKVDTFPP